MANIIFPSFTVHTHTHTVFSESLSTCCSTNLADLAHKVWENSSSQGREDFESHYHLHICWFHSSRDSLGANTCLITSCTEREGEQRGEEAGGTLTLGGGLIQNMRRAQSWVTPFRRYGELYGGWSHTGMLLEAPNFCNPLRKQPGTNSSLLVYTDDRHFVITEFFRET